MYQNRIELLDLDYHSLKKYIYKLLRVESFTWFPFAVNPTDFYLGMIMSMGENIWITLICFSATKVGI